MRDARFELLAGRSVRAVSVLGDRRSRDRIGSPSAVAEQGPTPQRGLGFAHIRRKLKILFEDLGGTLFKLAFPLGDKSCRVLTGQHLDKSRGSEVGTAGDLGTDVLCQKDVETALKERCKGDALSIGRPCRGETT